MATRRSIDTTTYHIPVAEDPGDKKPTPKWITRGVAATAAGALALGLSGCKPVSATEEALIGDKKPVATAPVEVVPTPTEAPIVPTPTETESTEPVAFFAMEPLRIDGLTQQELDSMPYKQLDAYLNALPPTGEGGLMAQIGTFAKHVLEHPELVDQIPTDSVATSPDHPVLIAVRSAVLDYRSKNPSVITSADDIALSVAPSGEEAYNWGYSTPSSLMSAKDQELYPRASNISLLITPIGPNFTEDDSTTISFSVGASKDIPYTLTADAGVIKLG